MMIMLGECDSDVLSLVFIMHCHKGALHQLLYIHLLSGQHVLIWLLTFYLPLGLLRTDSIPEVGEDAAATVGMSETLSEEEQNELRKELAKVNLLQVVLQLVLRTKICCNNVCECTVSALCIPSKSGYGILLYCSMESDEKRKVS